MHTSILPQRIILLLSLGFALGTSLDAAQSKPSKEFLDAKAAVQKASKNKSAPVRAAAISKLAEFPIPETAALAIKFGLGDSSKEVRQAATELLVGFREDATVGKYLVDHLKGLSHKDGAEDVLCGVLKVLGSYESPVLRKGVAKFLNDRLTNSNADFIFRFVDELGSEADVQAVPALRLLATAKAFDMNFGYRRAIVQALTRIERPEAVQFLIELIVPSSGLIQHDIVQHLTNITGERFRLNDQAWLKWWRENAASFEFPKADQIVEQEIDNSSPRYYGMPICAKRVAFVIDTSGSMRGEPLEAAKRELVETVKRLPDAVHFNIVVFNSTVQVWHPATARTNMVRATDEAKQTAIQMINSQTAVGDTASYDALETAFGLEPEVIFFLSDGAPTMGRVINPDEIVAAITAANFTRRVSIHTIGLGSNELGSQILGRFMQNLAESAYGKYRAVDR